MLDYEMTMQETRVKNESKMKLQHDKEQERLRELEVKRKL